MRLRIVLPKVKPDTIIVPTRSVYAGCRGQKFFLRQTVTKPLRDTSHWVTYPSLSPHSAVQPEG
jgi:hypothetical protein